MKINPLSVCRPEQTGEPGSLTGNMVSVRELFIKTSSRMYFNKRSQLFPVDRA